MFHDIEQGTDEWFDLRADKVTGSVIAKIMANDGKAFGEPAKRLAVDIAITQITGKVSTSLGYSNADMERGNEQEPLARQRYEYETFCTVKNGGFYDNLFTGCSPDGLVGDDGLIEIKSVIASVHYKRIKSKSYDTAYRWQLIFNLKESDRDWIDFVSFCDDFPEDKKLFICRLKKESLVDAYKQIDVRLEKFFKLVAQIKQEINNHE